MIPGAKGERLGDAVERHRHRLRELAADLHRVRSAPSPSSVAKAAAKIQFDALAEAGAPDVDRAVEHGLPVSLPTTMLSALVVGTDKPATVHHEVTDVLGLLCWTLRDTLLAKINAAIDEAADDKHALTQQQREEMEATIGADTLAVERAECAVIWAAEAKGEVIDFRRETSPLALLGIRLVNVPPAAVTPGSSLGMSWPWGQVGGR